MRLRIWGVPSRAFTTSQPPWARISRRGLRQKAQDAGLDIGCRAAMRHGPPPGGQIDDSLIPLTAGGAWGFGPAAARAWTRSRPQVRRGGRPGRATGGDRAPGPGVHRFRRGGWRHHPLEPAPTGRASQSHRIRPPIWKARPERLCQKASRTCNPLISRSLTADRTPAGHRSARATFNLGMLAHASGPATVRPPVRTAHRLGSTAPPLHPGHRRRGGQAFQHAQGLAQGCGQAAAGRGVDLL